MYRTVVQIDVNHDMIYTMQFNVKRRNHLWLRYTTLDSAPDTDSGRRRLAVASYSIGSYCAKWVTYLAFQQRTVYHIVIFVWSFAFLVICVYVALLQSLYGIFTRFFFFIILLLFFFYIIQSPLKSLFRVWCHRLLSNAFEYSSDFCKNRFLYNDDQKKIGC